MAGTTYFSMSGDEDSSLYSSDDGSEKPLNLAAPGKLPPKGTEISDNELIALSIRDLNRYLKGLPANEVRHLKQRRRTLKNRGYAASCREKRMTQKEELELERQFLKREVDRLKNHNQEVQAELRTLKSKYAALKQFAHDSSTHGAVSSVIVIKPEVDREALRRAVSGASGSGSVSAETGEDGELLGSQGSSRGQRSDTEEEGAGDDEDSQPFSF